MTRRSVRRSTFDPAGPERVRQSAEDGSTAVMKLAWRDPDDNRPTAAHRPRTVTGYRSFCPLRRMAARSGCKVTELHIHAADRLRLHVDLALIGCGARSMEAAHNGFGPSAGPSAAAVYQAFASGELTRALARFTPAHRTMLVEIVLLNRSLQTWCQRLMPRLDPDVEMGRLLTLLDILADHYADAIDADLAAGRLEAVA